MFEEGAKMVRTTRGPISHYEEYTTTNLYVERLFVAPMNEITVTNDSQVDTISLSLNGATLLADIKPEETLSINLNARSSIYVRGASGGGNVRIWGI
jgi:hypothetical protein